MTLDEMEDKLRRRIIQFVEDDAPESVEQLLDQIQSDFEVPRDLLLDQIIKLQNDGTLVLERREVSIPGSKLEYLLSGNAYWFCEVIILSTITVLSVYGIPEKSYPLVYLRYILGSIFILFLPGYSFIKALYPTREIDDIERIALSIGSSLVLVPLTGLLLNYTPWGIRLAPITISLLILTLTLSIVAVSREHTTKTRK